MAREQSPERSSGDGGPEVRAPLSEWSA